MVTTNVLWAHTTTRDKEGEGRLRTTVKEKYTAEIYVSGN